MYAYAGGNPISMKDPSGAIPIFVATAAVGAFGGFAGNLGYQLISNGGNLRCVRWSDVGMAAASGALAGALLPITGTTMAGAVATGAATNSLGYLGTQALNGEDVTGLGFANAAFWGAVGGRIGGKLSNPFMLAKSGLSPLLSNAELTAANTDALTIGRAVAGAGLGSEDPFADGNQCGCR